MSLPTNPNNGNFYGGETNPENGYNQPQGGTPGGKGKKIGLIAGASILTVGLLAGGAYAVTNGLNAVGDKDIAKAIPGSSAVFGEIDLDPSNAQKLGLVSAAQKIKDISKEKDIDPNKDPKELITDGFFKDLDFESEVKPWIGDKVAVAAWGDFSAVAKDYSDDYSTSPTEDYSTNPTEDYSTDYSEDLPLDYSEDLYPEDFLTEPTEEFSSEGVSIDRASVTTARPAPKGSSDSIHNVIVYEVKDEKKAQEAADKAFADKDEKFLVQDGYLIIGENQEDIDAYGEAIKNGSLADQESFKEDRKTFDQDAIATGWADLGKFDLGNSAKSYYDTLETKDGKPLTVEGRVITGLSLEQGKASSTTKVIDVKSNAYDTASATEAEGVKDIGNLPGNSFGAVALSGLDQNIKDAWEQNKESIENSDSFASTKQGLEDEYGISLPEDITKLIGSETAVGVVDSAGTASSGYDFGAILRLTGADAELYEKILADSGAGDEVTVKSDKDVLTLNYNGEDSGDKLSDNDAFKNAVGDYKKSQVVAFADIDKIAEVSGEESKGYGVVGLNGIFDKDENVTTITVNWVY